MPSRDTHNGFPVADALPRLHEAALEDDASLLRRTLRHHDGPDDDIINVYWDGETALHVACRLGHYGIARALIEHGADVTACLMFRSVLPLGVAIENEQSALARLIIDEGKFFESAAGRRYGPEALCVCAAYGNAGIHAYIVKQDCVDLNHTNNLGWSPLRMAVNYRRKEMVQGLLEAGANPDILTPLDLAVLRHQTAVVSLFIRHKVDINAYSVRYGCYAIHLAVETNRVDMIRMVLGAKCDPHLLSKEGKTPLYRAAELGYQNMLEELLAAGADPNKGMPVTKTPPLIGAMDMPVQTLYINPNKAASPIVLQLLRYGADCYCDSETADGSDGICIAPFRFAVEKGHFRSAMMLMAADCCIRLGSPQASKSPKCVITGPIANLKPGDGDLEFMECYAQTINEGVLSLSRQSRRTIRRAITSRPVPKAIQQLPLPKTIKDFLLISALQNISDPETFVFTR